MTITLDLPAAGGLVPNLPDHVYHADPIPTGSLSVTSAKRLASSAARFKFDRDNPTEPSSGPLLFGKAVHSLLLGGPQLVEIKADDWRSPKTRAIRDEQAALGRIPLLTKEANEVRAMRRALDAHDGIRELLATEGTMPEVSAFRPDPVTGRWLRARFDLLLPDGIGDYKTADSADPAVWVRRAIEYGYHWQTAWYLDMAEALGRDVSGGFRFVVQEKKPPYLASLILLDTDTIALGRAWNRWAIDRWNECAEANSWPGYPNEPVTVSAPPWAPRPPTIEAEPDDRPDLVADEVFAYLDELNQTEGNES